MSEAYDYNFVSRINRAYSLYPEKLTQLVNSALESGTQFQKSYICGLIDYMHNRNDFRYSYAENISMEYLVAPDMVNDRYCTEAPIPEFMKHNVYVTKVGWS